MDLVGVVLPLASSSEENNCCSLHHYTTRQCRCCTTTQQGGQIEEEELQEETRNHNSTTIHVMASSYSKISPIISIFVFFLFFIFSVCPALSLETQQFNLANQTFKPSDEVHNTKIIKSHLMKINKPSLKTIQSPDGDLIDCVLSHQQPAFDHPQLKGQKPLEPAERPKSGHKTNSMEFENFQLWSMSGETCPEGTIPVRRTKEQDILRASSIRRFGRKLRRPVRRDTTSNGHEVSPELYGDNYPRFFTYWTSDAYQATGCYNLLCSGFVQTNNKIAIGAAISPTSSYNGGQYDISIMIWKDPKHGHWWLEFGSGVLVGYWPSFLFTHLRGSASMIQFGGEIVNSRGNGFHTSTQMGSGHFAGEGFGKASYFRNLQVVDWDNSLIPLSNLKVLADHSNCYDIQGGINRVWGNYFYYGGPGRNQRCP
ncbi:Pyruvate phosphate dikinase, PEP/pyruvate binding domain isoform 1 [Capsicum annuum]|nr:Pyruvate phosphate dikinase, PEP/pyruvate binding domain isoform 1 [Capsicum annuum]KAF3679424.1 Pyruvate phosphate dikinase, PEP/pyruvate binding domain isoform 1 [Capsicum annuum]